MTARAIVGVLRALPWAALAWLAAALLLMLIVWQLTKHHYAVSWLHWAPVKAQDVVIEARRRVAEVERVNAAQAEEIAELRGMVEGARQRLERPAHLRLVEQKGGRG